MITKIGLKNFRVFETRQDFELNPLTILTGTNNSGKSAIQKFLQLMQNSVEVTNDGKVLFDTLKFPEDINSQVGNFDNNISFNSEDDKLTFYFESDNSYLGNTGIELSYEKGDNDLAGRLEKITLKSDLISDVVFSSTDFTDKYDKTTERRWGIAENQKTGKLAEEIYKLFLLYKEGLMIESHLHPSILSFKSPDIMSLIGQYLEKGFRLNYHPRIDELGDAFGIIWDPINKKTVHYNIAPDWYQCTYLDQSRHTVISTLLSNLVLVSDILSQPVGDEKLIKLKELLGEKGILTKDDFIEEYRKFELMLLEPRVVMFTDKSSDKYKALNEFIYSDKRLARTVSILFEDIDSPIVGVLESDTYKACFSNEITVIEAPKKIGLADVFEINKVDKTYDYKVRERDVIHNSFLEELRDIASHINNVDYLFRDLIKQFGDNLGDLKNNLIVFSQQHKFTRYLLFNDTGIKGEALYKLMEFIRIKKSFKEGSLEFLKKWLKKFNLGEMLDYEPIKIEDREIGYSFSIKKNGESIPLHTNGLGGSKVIALIIQIIVANKNATILLEEPESNLHPAYQSKLAEMVAEASKEFGIRFIVETHSEYFIRKIQYLVASSTRDLSPEDVAISYLYHPNHIPKGKKQVEKLEIRPDGILKQDFGEGFFDENARLTMDLLRLQNQN